MKHLPLVFAALFAGAALTLTFISRAHNRARTDAAICVKIHRLDVAIQGIISAASSPAVLRKIAYYREHPAEMDAVIANADRQLATLRAADCAPAESRP